MSAQADSPLVSVHDEFECRLPTDDTHPYRTGAWRPQRTEFDARLTAIEGAVPEDLAGVYLRNTENPLLEPITTYHPFDGDGMLHSVTFDAGAATYHNRFVRTDGFLAEQEAGEALWAGVAELPATARRTDGWGARPQMKDGSSTDVVVHRGVALSSFWMCGDLYRHDPATLEPLGRESWGGRFPREGVSAHPKVDERTGEMLFFNYGLDSPHMHYGEISATGELQHYVDVELPGPRLPHDMAFTEHYAILCDFPMFWSESLMESGIYAPSFHKGLPSRFAVVPRSTAAKDGAAAQQVQWFEADPTYVLHFVNAYEQGDEIVMEGYFQHQPSLRHVRSASFEENLFRYLDMYAFDAHRHEWRFNLRTGVCTERSLGDEVREFGTINGTHGGRPHRYSYCAIPAEGWFGFTGFAKYDSSTGTEERVDLPDGVFASETVMAPRVGSNAEDDGYLVTITMDMNTDESHCVVFDAAAPTEGPVVRLRLPERVSSGTHACWSPTTGPRGTQDRSRPAPTAA